ncbi:MAG: restriction endonuclease subunit S [Lachnospiraceae bacterium]|nr:restriction endonuclease subunit S [Lachnospiraceae bacterium]
MANTPNIRFKGFTDAWEQRKLGEVLSFQNGFNGGRKAFGEGVPLISVMDILNNQFISYDVIRGKATVTDDEYERYAVRYGDVLFQRSSENVEDAGSTNVYIDTDKIAIFGGFVIRGKQIYPYRPKFMKYLLDTKNVRNQITKKAQGAQHVNVSQETLQDVMITLPSESEQLRIETCLYNLDNLISLHQRKCDETKELKKFMLQKVFPKNGEQFPEIRFAGFTDAWEQRKLGDMLDRYEDPVETPHDGYERIGIRSHAKGVFHSYVEPGKELDTAKMHRVAADKFILNITFAWEHAVAITEEEDAGTLVSHRFPQFSFHKDLKSHFFKFLMLDRKFREYLELCSPGGAGRNRVLNINDMLKYKINVPSVEEQTKIGEYLDTLDNLITLHQRKCDELKEFKKFMLQNMFP